MAGVDPGVGAGPGAGSGIGPGVGKGVDGGVGTGVGPRDETGTDVANGSRVRKVSSLSEARDCSNSTSHS